MVQDVRVRMLEERRRGSLGYIPFNICIREALNITHVIALDTLYLLVRAFDMISQHCGIINHNLCDAYVEGKRQTYAFWGIHVISSHS